MNTTPAPRPAAADLDAARKLARQLAGTTSTGTVAWDAALAIRDLAADLAATRAERDAARATVRGLDDAGAKLTSDVSSLRDALDRAEEREAELTQERDAAIAERDLWRDATRGWIAANGSGGWIDDLRKAAPVPAADVPPFLAHRVNGGAM